MKNKLIVELTIATKKELDESQADHLAWELQMEALDLEGVVEVHAEWHSDED